MHAVVLGAGVVGVTTAYYLSLAGWRVTVVERLKRVAGETSFANGGQLSYGFAEALGNPEFLRKLPGLLAGKNFATSIRITPRLLPWGIRFLLECRRSRARRNTETLLDLAQASEQLMDDLLAATGLEFSFRRAGKIVLLSTDQEVRTAERATRMKRARGLDIELLSRDEAESVEPAIASFRGPVKAAAYARNDDVGDAALFTAGLKTYLEQQHGVTFLLETGVAALNVRRGKVVGVRCTGRHEGAVAGDAVVVCLGAWSNTVLGPVGAKSPVFPVRGYSLTLPAGRLAPAASLTTLTNRFVFSRLDCRMRIAGFTDFDDYRQRHDADRIATLASAARRLAPDFADYDAVDQHGWGGFRPMTPSGLPVAGPTRIAGLYRNVGHGMLGWTLACATAKSVADVMQARSE